MKWVTRARPKTDRIACPWLIRRFIDPDAEILYVPTDEVLAVADDQDAPQLRRARRRVRPPRRQAARSRCSSTHYDLGERSGAGPAGRAIVHAADIDTELHTDPLGPGLLAIGARRARRRSRRPPAAGAGLVRLRRALRLVQPASRGRRGMTEHLDYDDLRADTVRQVAKLMAAAAITAPKSGGQLFLARQAQLHRDRHRRRPRHPARSSPSWMRARGKERREAIWFRDADVAEAIDAVLFVGLADWYPPNYDCGACGYATCAEFLHATKPLRDDSAELEFAGPTCNLRDIDLGIAVGSAAKTAAIHSIDCRCQTRIAVAARKLGIIHADVAVALSLSLTHKAVGFDRRITEVDFDALDLPATGTLPIGVEGAARADGARNRQQPRTLTSRRGERTGRGAAGPGSVTRTRHSWRVFCAVRAAGGPRSPRRLQTASRSRAPVSLEGWRSFDMARASIWRMRSRVRLKCSPTSSRVRGSPRSRPKRSLRISAPARRAGRGGG